MSDTGYWCTSAIAACCPLALEFCACSITVFLLLLFQQHCRLSHVLFCVWVSFPLMELLKNHIEKIPCWRHILWLSCQVVHVDEQLRLMPQVNSDKVLLLRHVMAIFCWSLVKNCIYEIKIKIFLHSAQPSQQCGACLGLPKLSDHLTLTWQ